MPKEGDLDNIGGDPPEAAAPAPEPVQDAPEAQAAPEGDDQRSDKPEHKDTRPEGYVTKGERDRIAAERDLYRDRFDKVVEKFFKQPEPEQAKPEEDPMPDYNQDPLGWIGWRQRQDQRAEETKQAQQEQWKQQAEQQRQFEDTLNRARTRFQRVAAERPEVNELYQTVQNKVGQMYAEQGVPHHQIPSLIQQYEASVIQWARQENLPIEEALEQAAARFGVAMPRKPAQEQKPTPERDPATGQFVAEAEKAAKVRESQERNASLSSAPGSPVKKMTGTELAKMSEEDMWRQFESVGRKPGAKQFDRDMGFRS